MPAAYFRNRRRAAQPIARGRRFLTDIAVFGLWQKRMISLEGLSFKLLAFDLRGSRLHCNGVSYFGVFYLGRAGDGGLAEDYFCGVV